MLTFLLKPGLAIRGNDRIWFFRRRQVDRRLQFSDECGEVWQLSEAEFYAKYERRELTVEPDQPYLGEVTLVTNAPRDLTTFPLSQSKEAERRRQYLAGLTDINGRLPPSQDLPDKITAAAAQLGDAKRPPSVATLYRWHAAFQRTKCAVRLVPKHWMKGRKPIFTGELESLLLDVIHEKYLDTQRRPVLQVWKEFETRLSDHNRAALPSCRLKLPSRSSVYRYVENLDCYLVDCSRLGKKAADRKHQAVTTEMQVKHILDRWEIDHTLLDVLIVDSDSGSVIGRPYVTVVLDRASRMVMAALIHISAPSTESVLRVLERAIRPKEDWLSRYPNIINAWPARGLPKRLVPDNAAEFHAGDLHLAFNDLGIELFYPPGYSPQRKGAVERFFRTMNMDLIHCLPGTTRSNPKDRGDYKPERHACLTMQELEEVVLRWIVDCYHQRPHRSLKKKRLCNFGARASRLARYICLRISTLWSASWR